MKKSKFNQPKSSAMEALLASLEGKTLSLDRGDQITGKVILITNSDIIFDLGTKSEGILPKNDLSADAASKLKVGDSLSMFVVLPENEAGQTTLSMQKKMLVSTSSRGGFTPRWDKFIQAQRTGATMTGKVLELNKGGAVVEVDGTRGFLPSSQIKFSVLGPIKDISELIDKDLQVKVIEVDQGNNRLIFTQKTEISQEEKDKLAKFKTGETVKGEVGLILPNFGLLVNVDGIEGFVHIQDISWEKVDQIDQLYKVGQAVEAQITGIDETLGRVNLSLKQLEKDPFTELGEKYQPDDVVSGVVKSVGAEEVVITLKSGPEAVLKPDGTAKYEVGQEVTVLIDSVDARKRKITVAPMLTSTSGLIYK